jgi:hypothetical protein
MNAFLALRDATLRARARTGDSAIATSVKAGMFRVERVTRPTRGVGTYTVTPLSERLSLADAIAFLDNLQ